MGNTGSTLKESNSNFNNKFNWILSYPMLEYPFYNIDNISKDNLKNYIDLRLECPPVINIGVIPIHPIASVVSILNYQLVKNKLTIFPPSKLFIYNNCKYFENISGILSFEVIFKAIEKYGFCSEIDYMYHTENISNLPSPHHYTSAEPYKFIEIFRVKNDLNTLKIILNEKQPILIGFVLYLDLFKIVDKIWLPDFDNDKRIGGCTAVIVGYNNDSECFFLKLAYGTEFGNSGYITIPYEYITNCDLTPELYYIDFKKNRVEGYLNQTKEMISIQKKTQDPSFNSIFN